MEIEILKERDVPLLKRKRVTAMVTYDGGATPNILALKDVVASKLKVESDLVAIRHVYQQYGFTQAKVIAHIYTSRDELLKLEKMKKAERKAAEAAKKAAEEKAKADADAKKAAEEAKAAEAEAPKEEEKKEEAPAEVKEEAPKEEEKKEEAPAEAKEEVVEEKKE